MNTVTFKQFKSDYEKYYEESFTDITTEDDMDEVMYDLYGNFNYVVDYGNKLLELY